MWTFRCPANGTVRLIVETKDDTDKGLACVSPLAQILDGNGDLIASRDNGLCCTYRRVCNSEDSCPFIEMPCGVKAMHSIIVRDVGPEDATNPQTPCNKGGG